MSELVAVDKAALDRAVEFLRGHASFKRSGHTGYTSAKGADQIDAIAENLTKQYPVHVDLSQSARACEVGQHAYSDNEGVCIFCDDPRP